MKSLFVCLSILFSLSAVAGPEEHQQAQKCYYLSAVDAKRATENVPTQICLETLSIDLTTNTISIYSYFQPYLYQAIKLESLVRKNEDTYFFKSSGVFHFTNDDQNGQLERLTILVSGQTDFLGEGDPAEVTIEVKQDTRFTPHSATLSNFYKYDLQ